MADTTIPAAAEPPKKRGLKSLVLSGIVAILAGGGAFFAIWSGLVPVPGRDSAPRAASLPDIAFVPLDPLIVSLGGSGPGRHLRFTAQVEVAAPYKSEVEHLRPRILDLLNGYLRALTPAELEAPAAMVRLRAQMLRRLQIVTGDGRVRDLLITECVIN